MSIARRPSLQFPISITSRQIAFVSDHTIAYRSGNAVHYHCLDNVEAADDPIVAEEGFSLDAFAGSRYGSMVAIAVHAQEALINLYKFPDNTLLTTLQDGADIRYKQVALSARAARLVSLSDLPDTRLVLWDTESGRQIGTAIVPDNVTDISFDPIDHSIFACFTPSSVIVWQSVKRSGEYTLSRRDHDNPDHGDILGHIWDGSHQVLFPTSHGAIYACPCSPLSPSPPALCAQLSPLHPFTSIAISSHHIILGTLSQIIFLNIQSGYRHQFTIDIPILSSDDNPSSVFFISFFSRYGSIAVADLSGRLFTSVLPLAMTRSDPGSVPSSPSVPVSIPLHLVHRWITSFSLRSPSPSTRTAMFFPSGATLLVWGYGDNRLDLWDCDRQVVMKSFAAPFPVIAIEISPDSRLLFLSLSPGTLALYDVRQPALPRLIRLDRFPGQELISLRVSPSGSHLSCVDRHGRITIYDLAQLSPLPFPSSLNTPILASSWVSVPDQDLLAVSSAHGDIFILTITQSAITIKTQFIGLAIVSMASSPAIPFALFGLCRDRALKRFQYSVKDGTVVEGEMWFGHEVVSGDGVAERSVAISGDGRLIGTCAADGFIIIRPVTNLSEAAIVPGHNPHYHGASAVSFNTSAALIVTSGPDGAILCWSSKEYGAAMKVVNSSEPIVSDQEMDRMTTVGDGGALMADDTIRDAVAANGDEPGRQEQIRERQQVLQTIKERFDRLVSENEQCNEIERVDQDELVIDLDLFHRLTKQGKRQVKRVKDSILEKDLTLQVLSDRVKSETWDIMESQTAVIPSFVAEGETSNFPIAAISREQILFRQRVLMLRKMQILEGQFLSEEIDPTGGFRPGRMTKNVRYIVECGAVEDGGDKVAIIKKGDEGAATIDGAGQGTRHDRDEIGERNELHPIALWSQQKKTIQVVMIEMTIEMMRRGFNDEVTALGVHRQGELEKIQDIERTIRDVSGELEIEPEPNQSGTLRAIESADQVLQVGDEEIAVPLVLTKTEMDRKRLADREQERIEAARRADNVSERALLEMMNGTLESKKGLSSLSADIERPKFMDIVSEDKWNEEEKALAVSYAEKCAVRAQERDARKKQLETLLKKSKSDIGDIIKNFDERVERTRGRRMKVQGDILALELCLVQLQSELLFMENKRITDRQYDDNMIALQTRKQAIGNTISALRHALDLAQKQVEQLHNDERQNEKNFRKDFADAGSQSDLLYKWFRSKRGTVFNQVQVAPDTRDGASHGDADPYLGCDDRVKGAEAMVDSDLQSCKPGELSVAVWDRFVERRLQRLAQEQAMKGLMKDVEEMEERLELLDEESWQVQVAIRALRDGKEQSLGERTDHLLNTMIIIRAKQGQVEIDENPLITDLSGCQVIDRGEVEKLNEKIVELGSDKVGVLKDITDFRKGINMLLWTKKSHDLLYQEYQAQTAEFQALRVTKALQELIKVGGQESRHATEVQQLQQKTEFLTNINKKKIKETRRKLMQVRRKTKRQASENERLGQSINGLQVAVNSRKQIVNIRHNEEDHNALSKRMKSLILRRNLIDLVHAQSAEIDYLRKDLDTVRKRTFPSFAAAKKSTNRNRQLSLMKM